jgi:hypothetical protein
LIRSLGNGFRDPGFFDGAQIRLRLCFGAEFLDRWPMLVSRSSGRSELKTNLLQEHRNLVTSLVFQGVRLCEKLSHFC